VHTKKGGRANASILCEVPHQEGNERRQGYHHEEWQAGDSRRVPCMRDQDVQNRQELALLPTPRDSYWAGYSNYRLSSPLAIYHIFEVSVVPTPLEEKDVKSATTGTTMTVEKDQVLK